MQPESGVVATKVGTEYFTMDANWILVSTPTGTSWQFHFILFWMRLFTARNGAAKVPVWMSVPVNTSESAMGTLNACSSTASWAAEAMDDVYIAFIHRRGACSGKRSVEQIPFFCGTEGAVSRHTLESQTDCNVALFSVTLLWFLQLEL